MRNEPIRAIRRAGAVALAAFVFLAVSAPIAAAGTAYVTNEGQPSVSVIDTATNKADQVPDGQAIKLSRAAGAVAITPDGKSAYIIEREAGVRVINTATQKAEGATIAVGRRPGAIAITPDGRFAYVVNNGEEDVSVINTVTRTVERVPDGEAIKVGRVPSGIAISPDGRFAYVANSLDGNVSVINTTTRKVEGSPITVGVTPIAIAITPDGRRAYVTNDTSRTVSVIDTATRNLEPVFGGGNAIQVGIQPRAIAISPDGRFAYTANFDQEDVSVIDTATNKVEQVPDGEAIKVGRRPTGIAITPDGRHAYVSNFEDGNVSVIDTATKKVELGGAKAIPVGLQPDAIAIAPDQPPAAALQVGTTRPRPGIPLALDASASSDLDSAIATYAWSFGDGQSASAPKTTHTFAKPGTYQVSVKVTDAEGCSTPDTFLFTGQTAYCDGNAAAQVTKPISVAYPGVKVSCPKRAKPKACSFKLQAIVAKPKRGRKAKVESAVAKARVKAGRSAIVSLKPTAAFNAQLAAAPSVLVKETVTVGHLTKTRFAKLKIVQ
jgi:YVTN family beta-propeller protein